MLMNLEAFTLKAAADIDNTYYLVGYATIAGEKVEVRIPLQNAFATSDQGDKADSALQPNVAVSLGKVTIPGIGSRVLFSDGLNNPGFTIQNGLLAVSLFDGGFNAAAVFNPGINISSLGRLQFGTEIDAANIGVPSIAICSPSTGWIEINDGTLGNYRNLIAAILKTAPTTFASLTAPATAGDGAIASITDGNTAILGAIATGSGSLKQTLRSDGTDWRVMFTPV